MYLQICTASYSMKTYLYWVIIIIISLNIDVSYVICFLLLVCQNSFSQQISMLSFSAEKVAWFCMWKDKKREIGWWVLVSYPSCRFCFLLRRAWLRTAVWAWRSSTATGPSLPHKPSPGLVALCRLPYLPAHTPFHLQKHIQERHTVS